MEEEYLPSIKGKDLHRIELRKEGDNTLYHIGETLTNHPSWPLYLLCGLHSATIIALVRLVPK